MFLWLYPIHCQVEPAAFTPVLVPEGQHRLQSQYCLWYSRRSPGKQNHNFDQNLKLIGEMRDTCHIASRVTCCREVRQLRAVLVAVQPPRQAGGPRQPLRLPPVQDGHQADVGGRGQQVRRQVDRPPEKRCDIDNRHKQTTYCNARAQAWRPDVGRTLRWRCLASSSWWGRRCAGPWSPSGSRRTSSASGTGQLVTR